MSGANSFAFDMDAMLDVYETLSGIDEDIVASTCLRSWLGGTVVAAGGGQFIIDEPTRASGFARLGRFLKSGWGIGLAAGVVAVGVIAGVLWAREERPSGVPPLGSESAAVSGTDAVDVERPEVPTGAMVAVYNEAGDVLAPRGYPVEATAWIPGEGDGTGGMVTTTYDPMPPMASMVETLDAVSIRLDAGELFFATAEGYRVTRLRAYEARAALRMDREWDGATSWDAMEDLGNGVYYVVLELGYQGRFVEEASAYEQGSVLVPFRLVLGAATVTERDPMLPEGKDLAVYNAAGEVILPTLLPYWGLIWEPGENGEPGAMVPIGPTPTPTSAEWFSTLLASNVQTIRWDAGLSLATSRAYSVSSLGIYDEAGTLIAWGTEEDVHKLDGLVGEGAYYVVVGLKWDGLYIEEAQNFQEGQFDAMFRVTMGEASDTSDPVPESGTVMVDGEPVVLDPPEFPEGWQLAEQPVEPIVLNAFGETMVLRLSNLRRDEPVSGQVCPEMLWMELIDPHDEETGHSRVVNTQGWNGYYTLYRAQKGETAKAVYYIVGVAPSRSMDTSERELTILCAELFAEWDGDQAHRFILPSAYRESFNVERESQLAAGKHRYQTIIQRLRQELAYLEDMQVVVGRAPFVDWFETADGDVRRTLEKWWATRDLQAVRDDVFAAAEGWESEDQNG